MNYGDSKYDMIVEANIALLADKDNYLYALYLFIKLAINSTSLLLI
jgi:hypothetical protein